MGQTKEGARKALETTKRKYGVDEHGNSLFHKEIGTSGGRKSSGGPLKGNPELAKEYAKRSHGKSEEV